MIAVTTHLRSADPVEEGRQMGVTYYLLIVNARGRFDLLVLAARLL
jgi:hypothetical protein